MKVVNTHGGAVCDIEPGHTGIVNPRNAGVAGMISAGMLIRADASDDASVAARHNVDHAAEMRALSEALARTERESADRLAEINALSAQVRAWCEAHGADPRCRIVLSGYEGEHDGLQALGWRVVSWKTKGGYSGGKNDNQKRERLWLSPACLGDEAFPLFARTAGTP